MISAHTATSSSTTITETVPCLNTEEEKECTANCECTFCEKKYYGLHCIVDSLSEDDMTEYECVTNSCSDNTSEESIYVGKTLAIGTVVICGITFLIVLAFFISKECKNCKVPRFHFRRSFEMIELDEEEGL